MSKCKVEGCESTELIYSGIDAFMRGVPTETYCYKCGSTYAIIKQQLENAEVSA